MFPRNHHHDNVHTHDDDLTNEARLAPTNSQAEIANEPTPDLDNSPVSRFIK